MAAITQKTLSQLLKKRAKLESASKEVDTLEKTLLQRLKDGDRVKPGILVAEIKRIERRSVAWRPTFEREISKRDGEGKGEELADRILAATKASVFENLVVRTV
jgi:hypothetical protein